MVGLPLTWAATDLARVAKRWFRRLRRSDGLSCIVRAAAGDLDLSDDEFARVRRLLEMESTWVEVGQGTVEELAVLISLQLPERPDGSALAAGRVIAGGLLEFAVRDLEPEQFQQVLLARLERMQTDHASALDEAMLTLHADLAALSAHQDATHEERSARLMGQLARVLDRLPPGRADRGEVAVYLAALIRWLNSDPWPQDMRFAGRALTPAAIERKLRIAGRGDLGGQDSDADDLAGRCARLVVLGEPGSGKTWLARRTARRCAEAALNALAAGAEPDEVELPLYTSCARLAAAPSGDGIRHAVVASALAQLPDLGGSRLTEALRILFEERNTPTLLVADSLDEASGPDDRIRQADTLPPAWRIVLTSRPGSWNGQLAISGNDPARSVGVLQPLHYPYDVEPFIASWFSERPQWAVSLTAQLRDRPALQQAATVPLVLAFYCIIGGDQPLPDRRAELYAKVIRRMLTGRWRGGGNRDPDPDACLLILQDWAWSAAADDAASGVSAWADEFPAPRVRRSQDDRDALDHVAVPLGPPDPDTGMTQRRFIHRSLREHLVAEYVALRLPADEAAGELLKHLWYDRDWEYIAPLALARHPERDQVLNALTYSITGSGQMRADLSAVDGCWEFRRFLARTALESSERDWSPAAATMIGRARKNLVDSRDLAHLRRGTTHWPASDAEILRVLLGLLARTTGSMPEAELTGALVRLEVTPERRARAREELFRLLTETPEPSRAEWLLRAVEGLDPTEHDRARARAALLRLLATEEDPETARRLAVLAASLAVTAQAQDELLTCARDLLWDVELTVEVASLDLAAQQQAHVREALVGLLADDVNVFLTEELAEALSGFPLTEREKAVARTALLRRLAEETDEWRAESISADLAALDPTAQQRAQGREALLKLLAGQADPWMAEGLVEALARLAATAPERAQTQKAVLGQLIRQTDPNAAAVFAMAVAKLAVTPGDRNRAREQLLGLLTTHPYMTFGLLGAVEQLDPAEQDRARARAALLGLLARDDSWYARDLIAELVALAGSAHERAHTRSVLLGLLSDETDGWTALELAAAIGELEPPEQERARLRQALLGLLAGAGDSRLGRRLASAVTGPEATEQDRATAAEALLRLLCSASDPYGTPELAETLAGLNPAARQREQAVDALYELVNRAADPEIACAFMAPVARLEPMARRRGRFLEALLRLLSQLPDGWMTVKLAEAVTALDPAAADRGRAQQELLGLLGRATAAEAAKLARSVALLDPTAEQQAQARNALLRLLAGSDAPSAAPDLAAALAGLHPTDRQRAEARKALLKLLANATDREAAGKLAAAVASLTLNDREQEQARQAMVTLLARQTRSDIARVLQEAVAQLWPKAEDLIGWHRWAAAPSPDFLAAVRRNSALDDWLGALPGLSGLPLVKLGWSLPPA